MASYTSVEMQGQRQSPFGAPDHGQQLHARRGPRVDLAAAADILLGSHPLLLPSLQPAPSSTKSMGETRVRDEIDRWRGRDRERGGRRKPEPTQRDDGVDCCDVASRTSTQRRPRSSGCEAQLRSTDTPDHNVSAYRTCPITVSGRYTPILVSLACSSFPD